jgi:hypothetical protein
MSDPIWLPFEYRGFYDVPRMVAVRTATGALVLDCQFDPEIDDYPDRYAVYHLKDTAPLGAPDWTRLVEGAELTGSIPIAEVEFDSTRRKAVRASSIAAFL